MTVDEILATGQYTDRRGREWETRTLWSVTSWAYFEVCSIAPHLELPVCDITTTQMRLLIERDRHRDECEGLRWCEDHPVQFVQTSDYHGDFAVVDTSLSSDNYQSRHETLPEAMDAARALAVGG